jgi:uncharacterized protein YjbI with pentapeptide repeats
MAEDSFKGSDGFEPPKYLASLIAAVNDGAKAAQAGALFFALVGVYLLATAFSASDEDLLRGRGVTISQIGATLPVSFSFAIAPFVFVFLHIYTLVRYDMLAANLRQFLVELQRTVLWEVDRERCRQLLANVEFIQALVAPRGPRQYSPVFRLLVWGVVAIFPVFVLLVVQINALRYQSELITRVQQAALFLDLSALVWFFHRAPLDASALQRKSRLAEARRWAKLLWLPAIVMGLNLAYMNVVPAEADARLVRYDGRPEATWEYLTDVIRQPLDVVLCPSLKWGCRYLRVDNRTLVDHVWDDKAMADLQRGDADRAKLAAIGGVVLRNRSLRFAVLDESSLFAADLIGADLRKASLRNARLPGAKLYGSATQMQGANPDLDQLQGVYLRQTSLKNAQQPGAKLSGSATQLQGADLYLAELQRANLSHAQLQGASLNAAQLQGASLFEAQLQGADLSGARLQGGRLVGAHLEGAELQGAGLQGAELMEAQLEGADLSGAQLQGATLFEAWLQGAYLNAAQLQGAELRRARFWRASFDSGTDLGLSDLQQADFTTPLTDNDLKIVQAAIDAIPEAGWKAAVEKRLGAWPADQSADHLRFTASSERQVLVSDPKNPLFAEIPTEWLIATATPEYTTSFVALLADELASSGPAIAHGIYVHVLFGYTFSPEDWRRSLYAAVACRLMADAGAKKVKLEQPWIDELRDQKIECEPAKPAAPR